MRGYKCELAYVDLSAGKVMEEELPEATGYDALAVKPWVSKTL